MSVKGGRNAPAATLTDVAKRAGVSPATVSRFLSGQNIRHAEVVWRAVEELGYAPNRLARSLKSGRTRNIGVVVPDITNPFFGAVVKGIEASSSDQAYNLLLCNTDENAERQNHLLKTLVGAVDALILSPAIESPDAPEALIHHQRVPVVLLDREFGDGECYDSVLVDNVGGARAGCPLPDGSWSRRRRGHRAGHSIPPRVASVTRASSAGWRRPGLSWLPGPRRDR